MASTSNKLEDIVVLELVDPSVVTEKLSEEEITISTSSIHNWDIPSIVCHRIVKVQADRSRLSEKSCYFHSLLSGNFSESRLYHISIHWSMESILNVLQFIYGYQLIVTSTNFLNLLEAALFFGVDSLLLDCEAWFQKFTSGFGLCRHQISLASIIEISNFSLDHGITSIMGTCKDYIARNFAWAASSSSFVDIPYTLLYSAIEHPELTVESEAQLCEALLGWLSHNIEFRECFPINYEDSFYNILKKVRICLLPLDFATGTRRCFPSFADDIIHAIIFVMNNHRSSLINTFEDNDCSKSLRIRLTKYSEKIVLCGCPHVTMDILFLGILPNDIDFTCEPDRGDYSCIIQKAGSFLSFESVVEVDISKCPNLRFALVIQWLYLAFPSLRILKASHYLDFKYENLYSFLRMCPHIVEVDLTVDISPVIFGNVSVLSANVEEHQFADAMRYKILEEKITLSSMSEIISAKPVLANITKLTLEGRSDTNDLELLKISSLLLSLSFLNIKGCTLVTDMGISKLLMKCPRLQSLISSYTAFGRNSIKILCLEKKFRNGSDGTPGNSSAMASRLQELQIDGCKDVDNNSLLHLMSKISIMRVLSLRETSLDDDALYKLASCSLEKLDISDTLVSMQSLNYVIKRNPEMRSLRGTGCSKLHHGGDQNLAYTHRTEFQDFLDELGKRCMLEELALGWGFSSIGLERLQPAFRNLRILYVGLGAEMDHHLLCLVPKICPLLESLVLRFQVIYDDIVRSILESLKHLQMLWLCCCLGYFTSLSFQIPMLNLTSLKLDWVTPWMTNNDLILLTQNCSNVLELSLSGCKLLDSGSQEIIASGWPGLKYVHLEECGRITSQGVTFLYNCKAIEELKLRHNGRGLARNFMLDAASKLPLLRRLSLDLCDAVQGGFDSPSHSERFYLSTVKICRCKAQRCAFKLEKLGGFNPEHKETIVLEYTSKQLRTTVVRERI
ncbi:BTB/POZ domain-containing protein FBL11 isoform X2 [Dendrobium catenatum]|uniref:BTB/POZ domain-containing protein FBL11 isoform X2 n=1 Tax=Dendrobium catenatum TaxID=906689 RepID=UPI0009F5201D|nr:BTB/POZ domain-containing protein FBL11 isoform X2 [Dendrobium catenatum]